MATPEEQEQSDLDFILSITDSEDAVVDPVRDNEVDTNATVLANTDPISPQEDVPFATMEDIFGTAQPTGEGVQEYDVSALMEDIYGRTPTDEEVIQQTTEHKGGIVSSALEVGKSFSGGIIRGAVQELGTQIAQEDSEFIQETTKDLGGGLSGDIGSGFGQAGARVGVVSLFSGLGALAGAPFGGVGAVPGAAIGGIIGTGIGSIYTTVQGTRAELKDVEQDIRRTSTATGQELEDQVAEARRKARAPILVGQVGDTALSVFTGGSVGAIRRGTVAAVKAGATGGIRGGTTRAALEIEQAILKRSQAETLRQLTRAGKIKAAIGSGITEAGGEYISEVGKSVAKRTTLEKDTDTLDILLEEATSPEAGRAALVGGIVGTGVRGLGEVAGSARRKQVADEDRGLEIYAEALSGKLTGDSARAIEINRAIAAIENPEDVRTEVEIPDYVATREELQAVVDAVAEDNIELGPVPTEAGNILRAKAERLQEIEEQARIIKGVEAQEAKLKKQIRQTEESIERQLNRAGDPNRDISQDVVGRPREDGRPQVFDTRTDEEILAQVIQTEEALNRKLQDLADLKEIEKELGIADLTKEQRRLIVEEAEGLQQFFANIEEDIVEDTVSQENILAARGAEQQAKQAQQEDLNKQKTAERLKDRKVMSKVLSDLKAATPIRESDKLSRQIVSAVDQLRSVEGEIAAIAEDPTQIETLTKLKERQSLLEIKVENLRQEKETFDKETGIDHLDRNARAEVLERAVRLETLRKQGKLLLEQDHLLDPRSDTAVDAEVSAASVVENKTNTKPKNALAAIYISLKKAFNLDKGSVRQEIISSRIEAENLRDSIIKGLDADLARIDRAIKQVINVKATDDTFLQKLKRTPKRAATVLTREKRQEYNEQLERVAAYLKGDLIEENLDRRLLGPAVWLRTRIDALTTKLQEQGTVEGDLALILEQGKGTYINRSYQIFRDPKWAEKVDEGVKRRAKSFLRNELARDRNKPEHRNKSDLEWENHIHAVMETLLVKNVDSPYQVLSNTGVDKQVRNILKRRKDVPEPIRALWGEDTNVITMYANTMHQMAQLLGAHKHLSTVRDMGLGDFLFKAEDRRPGFAIPISQAQIPALEPIADLYTSQEVYNELVRQFDSRNLGWGGKFYLQVNGIAKYGSTVLSPITQWRNFYSNWFILARNGNLINYDALVNSGSSFKLAFGDILPGYFLNPKHEGQSERLLLYQELIELGVIDDAVTAAEWEASFQDAFGKDVSFQKYMDKQILGANKTALQALKQTAAVATDISTRLYRASDTVAKTIAWHAEYKRYKRIYPNWTDDQLKRKAAQIVRATMPTYSLVPDVIKWNRRNIAFGPFVSFASEAIRNEFNTTKLIFEELGKSETFLSGINRLVSNIATKSFRLGLIAYGRSLTHTTEEEEEAIRGLAAPWDKNSSLLFVGKDKQGNPRYYNISRTLPDSQIIDPLIAFNKDASDYEMLKAGMLEFLSPFISEELIAQRVVDAARGVRADGVQIYSSEDTDSEKWQKRVLHVLDGITPGGIRQLGRAWAAYNGEPTRSGQPLYFADEAIALTTGQRITTLDVPRAISFKVFDFTAGVSQATKDFGRVLRKKTTITNSEIQEAYTKLQAARQKRFQQMTKEYYYAIKVGAMPPEDLDEFLLDETDIGVDRLDYVIEGTVEPYFMSDSLFNDIEKIPGRLEQIEEALGPEAEEFL